MLLVGVPGIVLTICLMVALVAWIGWPETKPKSSGLSSINEEKVIANMSPETRKVLEDTKRAKKQAEQALEDRKAEIATRLKRAEDNKKAEAATKERAREAAAKKAAREAAAKKAAQPKTWELDKATDEFGDPTGTIQLSGIFEGEMSNSATLNSEMTAVYQVYKSDGILKSTIMIMEYHSNPVDLQFRP